VAGTAKKSSIPGEYLPWREALVCGPTPAGLSDAEFLRLRAKHLAEAYDVSLEQCEQDLREQSEFLSRFSDHGEVVLWFENDLFCQVHLIYLLNWFAKRELGETKLSLIFIGEFAGVEDFRGLGQLNREQLASLFPQRREVTRAQLHLGSKAWQAYSSADPREIESLLSSDTSALPFLQSALAKHLERFPSVRNGLGRIENLALELISDGHYEFKSLFPEFGKREPVYGFGDAQVLVELKRMAKAANPLLKLNNGGHTSSIDSDKLAGNSFRLTDRGEAVLRGDDDFVRLNGIDLWLGGVHLAGREAAWRWDDEQDSLLAQ
jgi:hypothetical protein